MLILRWLASQALKAREILSLLGITVFCLWLSNLPTSTQRMWRTGLATTIFYPIHLVVERIHFRIGLENSIGLLRSENAQLLAENAKLSEIADIRRELSAFESIKSRIEFPLIGARVISRDPVRMGGLWILDEGSSHGLAEGMAIISSKGVVGRIITAMPGYSQMQSLADPDCRVAVVSRRSRNPGILHSPDGSGVVLEFSVTSDIRVGDSLVTWGAGGIFPRGLPVGRVHEITGATTNILRYARVVPFQDPWDVRDVFVLIRPPSLLVMGNDSVRTPDSLGALQP
jgi:rod shape-determining protein MreC